MNYSYHNHTFYCSHATGTPEEYVKRAIECGVKHMGFSEHCPLVFSTGLQSKYRLQYEDIGAYFEELLNLKEKYKNEIDIKIGFEMEYYPELFFETLQNAKNYGAEYLILGQHYTQPEYMENSLPTPTKTSDEARLQKYVSLVVEAIKTGVFTYVAHPDMINFVGDEDVFRNEFRKICITSRENNIPLEINFLGIRANRNYPNEKAIAVMGEEKNPVTFGFDAHDAPSAFDGQSLQKALALVEKYKLNYIGKPEIIKL